MKGTILLKIIICNNNHILELNNNNEKSNDKDNIKNHQSTNL